MVKILFLSEDIPLGFNHTGVSSFVMSHLRLLSLLNTEKEIILARIPTSKIAKSYNAECIPVNIHLTLKETPFLFINTAPNLYMTFPKFLISRNGIHRESLIYPIINQENIRVLQSLLDEIKPDIIWAEHLVPFILASHLHFKGKVIYSHHDFLWKLQLIRRTKLKDRIRAWMLKKIEEKALTRARWVVNGAINELDEIKYLTNANTFFLPTIYPKKEINNHTLSENAFRIVHLGTLRATANRIGLKILLKEIIPVLAQKKIKFECWLIGDLSNADNELELLMKQPYVHCKGFVQNLDEVLFPNNIHIVAYDKATGTRTRVTQALNYQQVLVAHINITQTFNGLVDGENCVLATSSKQMVEKLEMLYKDKIMREVIASNGKKWCDSAFNEEKYSQKLKAWLEETD